MSGENYNDQPPLILVVDDETGPRESLNIILGHKYRINTASNGTDALKEFERNEPDLVISDIRMPGMSGTTLLHEIKSRAPEIPIILITGYANLKSAQEAVRGRAFDYIDKPYDVKEIQNLVEKALSDMEERRKHQRLVQQLQSWNRDLQDQIGELDQKATVADLSAELIHDINNPMTVLKGYINLLEDSLDSRGNAPAGDIEEFLKVVKSQVEKCICLTRNFLDFSRPSGRKWEKVNLNNLIQDTLFVLRVRMTKSGVESRVHLDPELPELWLMPTAIQQSLYNLIANGVDALAETNEGGTITITSQLDKEQSELEGFAETAKVSIRDNGPGIQQERLERIFTPFFTTKEKGKGTGLGLSICKRLVNEHQGQLQVQSQPGQGACFSIILPFREKAPKETEQPTDEQL